MPAPCHLNGQEWVPGERQNQVCSLPPATQEIEQYQSNRQIAKYKCNFQRKCGFVNRGYDAEE